MQGDFARVDFGAGTIRDNVNVSLVEAKVGEYVLVHAGYAIQIVDEEEAKKTLQYWNEILRNVPEERVAYESAYRGGF